MKKTILSVLFAVLFYGCATSYITSTWKAPGISPQKYNKVMVLGIISQADRTLKTNMEKHLAGDLKELGYNAFSAFEEYGPKAFENVDEDAANQKLAKEGVDAVVTIVLLDKQKERHYVPGEVVYTPYITYHDRLWGYYRSIYRRIETPGYYEETTKYFWESNLYDLHTSKLIYSVQTQSFDPVSAESLAHEYGQKIVQNMTKNNVLQKAGEKTLKAM